MIITWSWNVYVSSFSRSVGALSAESNPEGLCLNGFST